MPSKASGENGKERLCMGGNPCHHCSHITRCGSEEAEVISLGGSMDDIGTEGEAGGGDQTVHLDGLPGGVEGQQLDLGGDKHGVGGTGSLNREVHEGLEGVD